MTNSEKYPHLGIPNPSNDMFQAFAQKPDVENCPRNWAEYFEAAQQWIQEKLEGLKITEIIVCQYWVTLIIEECSEETEEKVKAILDNASENPFKIGFGRATEETMQHW